MLNTVRCNDNSSLSLFFLLSSPPSLPFSLSSLSSPLLFFQFPGFWRRGEKREKTLNSLLIFCGGYGSIFEVHRAVSYPGVAKFGIALDWGSRGRRFKSCHSDHRKPLKSKGFGGFSLLFKRLLLSSVSKNRGCLTHLSNKIESFSLAARKLPQSGLRCHPFFGMWQ